MRVCFYQQIEHNNGTNTFVREGGLPFVPAEGLHLLGLTEDADENAPFSLEVGEVFYDVGIDILFVHLMTLDLRKSLRWGDVKRLFEKWRYYAPGQDLPGRRGSLLQQVK